MAFIKAGSLVSVGAPVLRKETIANSVVMTPQAAVYLSAGFLSLATATSYVLGQVEAIQDTTGFGEITTGVAGAAIGSFVGTYTVANNNQTTTKVAAMVDISKFSLYSVSATAALGTTTGSNLAGYYTTLSSSQVTFESSATTSPASASTQSIYFIWGVDPIRSTNQIVSIFNSQAFN